MTDIKSDTIQAIQAILKKFIRTGESPDFKTVINGKPEDFSIDREKTTLQDVFNSDIQIILSGEDHILIRDFNEVIVPFGYEITLDLSNPGAENCGLKVINSKKIVNPEDLNIPELLETREPHLDSSTMVEDNLAGKVLQA